MPTLTNPKHEAACHHVVNGLSNTAAYEAAGYQRSPAGASQLFARPEIKARIQELLAEKKGIIQELNDDIDNLPSELNRDWLVKTLMKNVKLAQQEGQISAANKGVEMLAELIGLSIKKPGAVSKQDDNVDDDGKAKPELDLDRMADGIGKLGEILERRDRKAAEAEDDNE